MTRRVTLLCTTFLTFIFAVLPAHATTSCLLDFKTGNNNTYLSYCVTENGNILEIQTPFGQNLLGGNGEGYGICDQNIIPGGVNYTDYGVSDTGNWQSAVVVSPSSSSIKITRTTADGNWTLTQTITKVAKSSSITVVMALKNNQLVSDVAYLLRFANAQPGSSSSVRFFAGGRNNAQARTIQTDPNYGLQLSNVNNPPAGFFWQGFAQFVTTGPNACAFAFNEAGDNFSDGVGAQGSIELAYVGTFLAGQTQTVTLSYRGL